MDARTRFFRRIELAQQIERELGPFDPVHLDALVAIDRTDFVRPEDVAKSLDDSPLALDDEGLATISAPHAYLLSFRLVELARGDRVVELGSGSGYGAAFASSIVGPFGHVDTIEISDSLAARARELLSGFTNVTVHHADAVGSTGSWGSATRIICTFAVEEIPSEWIARLPDTGILVAPVGPPGQNQRLLRAVRRGESISLTEHGAVRYVSNRSLSAHH